MRARLRAISLAAVAITVIACSRGSDAPAHRGDAPDFESQVAEYIEQSPYQDTYNYVVRYTDHDPARLNRWVLGEQPALVKAGEDKVVRMNNDTFYKLAFVVLDQGPVVLESSAPTADRFYSFRRARRRAGGAPTRRTAPTRSSSTTPTASRWTAARAPTS